MGEFVCRWGLVAAVFWGMVWMFRGGSGTVWGTLGGFPVAVLVGFANALLRGLVLRVGRGNPVWELALGGACLNAALMAGLGAGGVGVWSGWRSPLEAWGCGLGVFGVSWAMSCLFRDHAGAWHWITHHGRVRQIRERRRSAPERG